MQLAIIWVTHVTTVLWMVKFPLYFMLLKRKHQMKYIHIIIVFMALVIPIVPVAVAFASGGFVNARFPPFLHVPA